jgi:hypothetical protein
MEIVPLSASPERIEAIMPANAPLGRIRLIVHGPNGDSRPFETSILANGFGIFTTNGKGWGPGVVWNLNAKSAPFQNSPRHAIERGGRVAMEGTGLSSSAPEVFVGGKRATHVSVSNLESPGRVRVEFDVPKDAPLGCFVPLYANDGSGISNVVTLAIADGATCPHFAGWPPPVESNGNVAMFFLARVTMRADFYGGGSTRFTADFGIATFLKEEPGDTLPTPLRLVPPAGTCLTYAGHLSANLSEGGFVGTVMSHSRKGLMAGTPIQVSGMGKTQTFAGRNSQNGYYQGLIGGQLYIHDRHPPLFFQPGEYRIDVSAGPDIPKFSYNLAWPGEFSWTNASELQTLDRKRGFTVKWRGARRGSNMLIAVFNEDQLTASASACVCVAAAEDGKFFVAPEFLSTLPATQSLPGIPMNHLLIMQSVGTSNSPSRIPGFAQDFGASLMIRDQTVEIR